MKTYNKKIKIVCLLTILIAAVLFLSSKVFIATAQINPLYNFKGKVTTATSTPVADGEYDLSFALYTAPTGGVSIWNEDLTAASRFSATISSSSVGVDTITYSYGTDANESTLRVGQHLNSGGAAALIVDFDTTANTVRVAGTAPVWADTSAISNRPRLTGGVLDVDLGTVSSLAAVNFNQPLYLEVTFSGETMQPRKLIAAVPQAFNAARLNGLDSSAFINTSDDITATGRWTIENTLRVATSSATTSLTVTQSGAGDILRLANGASDVLAVTAAGFVGIGTTTPDEALQVMGNIKWSGNLLALTSTQNIGSAVTRINTGYFTNLDVLNFTIGSTSISGTISDVFTINSDNVSVDAEDSFLAFHRGSSTPADAVIFWSSANDRFETNFPLHLQSNNFTTLGSAGIGTTSIVSRLTVNGDLALVAAGSYLNFGGGTGTSSYGFRDSGGTLQVKNSGGGWTNLIGANGVVLAGTAGQIPFYQSGGSTLTATSAIFIAANGYIGIGTSAPSSMLTVGAASGAQFLVNGSGVIIGGTWQGGTIGINYGGTGRTGWTANALVFASSSNILGEILPGTPGQILTMSGGVPVWQTLASATPALHDLLSTSHGDVTPGTVQNGDLITGQSGAWARYGIGGAGNILMVSGGQPTWSPTSTLGLAAAGHLHDGVYELLLSASTTADYYRGDKTWQTLNTLAVPEAGASLYWSQLRFDTALGATSSIATITNLPGLASSTSLSAIGTITTGIWNGSTVGVAYGGTGRTSWMPNALLVGSSTEISMLAAGGEGYSLAIVGGRPAWVASSTGASHPLLGSSHTDATTTGAIAAGDIIYRNAGNTGWTNLAAGSAGQVLMVSGGVPAWTGTSSLGFEQAFSVLGVAKGGTGTTTYANNEFLIFNGTSLVASGFSTSSFASTSHTHDYGIVLAGTAGQIPYYEADGRTLTGTSTLFITADGRVGIGTTTIAVGGAQNPRLQVAGAVAANYYCDENGNNCVDASNGWVMQSVFVGTTTTQTDGNFATSTLVGYQAANNICTAQYSGSHFCRTDEIIYTIQASSTGNFFGTAWIAEGPPGYTSNSNDCNGWKSSSTVALGAFWLYEEAGGGAGWLTNCSNIKPISCCR
jgi:hypothetical protein